MWYVATEIVLWMLAALLLGTMTGWLIWRVRAARTVAAEKEHLLDALERQEEELRAARGTVTELQDRIRDVESSITYRQERIEELEQQVAATSVAVKGLETARESLKEDLAARDRELELEREGAAKLERYAKQLREDLAARERELSERRSEGRQLEMVTERVAEREARVRELEPLEVRVRELQEELAQERERGRSMAGERAEELDRHRRRVAELEPLVGQVAALEARVGELEPLTERLEQRDREVARLREEADARPKDAPPPRPKKKKKKSMVRPSRGSAKDDLKEISGIGPAIERLLNRLGYRTFRDIAQWNEEEIDRVSGAIGAFAGRIRRDRWVQQAKRLHRREYGEQL